MEKVVYILGAGFSAPAGIPTIRDFLLRAKDMYFESDESRAKLPHFTNVLHSIGGMSAAKNYVTLDLLNIEEILSFLEMKAFLDGSGKAEVMREFIRDVIRHYTPEPQHRAEGLPGNWEDWLFGDGSYPSYGAFAAAIGAIRIRQEKPNGLPVSDGRRLWSQMPNPAVSYSVITLNYDELLEKPIYHMTTLCQEDHHSPTFPRLPIFYLHGSVARGDIVPPTWTKKMPETVRDDWRGAYKALTEANHIRFLGYSLPPSDLYVKYLISTGLLEAKHLKTIDVLCRDGSGEVEARYRAQFSFRDLRFEPGEIADYLSECRQGTQVSEIRNGERLVEFGGIEEAHRKVFG